VPEKPKDLLRRFIDEAWNQRNTRILEELLPPHFLHYASGSKEPGQGPAAYKQLLDAFTQAFPDRTMSINEAFGEGQQVCIRWTFQGTHRRAFFGLPAKRRKITLQGVAVARVSRGKILVVHSIFDTAELLAQMAA
jgi:steroid delta-isomerase-like uncharacterized protein